MGSTTAEQDLLRVVNQGKPTAVSHLLSEADALDVDAKVPEIGAAGEDDPVEPWEFVFFAGKLISGTPFELSVRAGLPQCADLLLNHGARSEDAFSLLLDVDARERVPIEIQAEIGWRILASKKMKKLRPERRYDDDRYVQTAEVLLSHGDGISRVELNLAATAVFRFVCMCDDIAKLEHLLGAGVRPPTRAFGDAASGLGGKCVSALLDAAASAGRSRYTPLHAAAASGNIEAVRTLLAADADPNVLTKPEGQAPGESPLSLACQRGHNEVVEMLLVAQADPMLGSKKNRMRTPLEAAAAWNRPACALLLLRAGADANAHRPIEHALQKGCAELLSLLLEEGAHLPKTLDPTSLDETILKTLRAHGWKGKRSKQLDVQVACASDGKLVAALTSATEDERSAVLGLAASLCRKPIVDFILKSRGPTASDAPLHAALRSAGNSAIATLLLDAGADPERAFGASSKQALSCLITPVRDSVVSHALKTSVEVSANFWYLASCVASSKGELGLLNKLRQYKQLKHSAVGESLGWELSSTPPPAHQAAASGKLDALKFVLSHVENEASASDESTPLHHAALAGQIDVTEWLLSNGSQPNAKTTSGLTPLDWAYIYDPRQVPERIIRGQRVRDLLRLAGAKSSRIERSC